MSKHSYHAAVLAALLAASAAGQAQSLPIPDPAAIPAGQTGDAIRRGRELVTNTRAQLPDNAGNGLNCTSCHLNGGTVAYAAPYVGLTGMFPEYRARSGKLISLQQRVNACFERSLNGNPLPWDSSEMNAMLAYISWLSSGVPTGKAVPGRGFAPIDTTLAPDAERGAAIYASQCSMCHGPGGDGMHDAAGNYVNPPLWGKDSFTLGAGMARHYTAAAFIKHNMPLGQGDTLTEQQAVDVAYFVTHQPRPDFPARAADWPKGGRPIDAR